ncbi:glycosyltransferase family 2 protein [Collinsella tanakaei]|nr:glycosyltransferase family 2 protein [Collinsella tanakaei]
MKPLVSVIMPSYNAERHIVEAIKSVQAQTLPDWELLVSDDCSTDSTRTIVAELAERDDRIRLFEIERNGGAAKARNNSLTHAKGRYVAYLDADDLWYPEKLERQVDFMRERGAAFSCASYEVIGEDGSPLGRTVRMLDECDYMGFLTHNLLQTVGIAVDTEVVDKGLLVMPGLKRCEDAATWLQVLKAGFPCLGLPEVLCGYRRVSGSLSSDKFEGAAHIWNLYRDVEHLPLPLSLYCFARYALLAVWKRRYPNASARQKR